MLHAKSGRLVRVESLVKPFWATEYRLAAGGVRDVTPNLLSYWFGIELSQAHMQPEFGLHRYIR